MKLLKFVLILAIISFIVSIKSHHLKSSHQHHHKHSHLHKHNHNIKLSSHHKQNFLQIKDDDYGNEEQDNMTNLAPTEKETEDLEEKLAREVELYNKQHADKQNNINVDNADENNSGNTDSDSDSDSDAPSDSDFQDTI